MKYSNNLAEVVTLQPDYLGFIFYERSPRYMANSLLPEAVRALPESIHRVGVFVNATTDYVRRMAERYALHALQLHGQEPPEQCKVLQAEGYTVIKVFSIGGEAFDFAPLRSYEPYVDFFLFDTRGKQPGGNGVSFNWELLRDYPLDIPFFLSGGIGPEDAERLRQIKLPGLHALDVNSGFEIEAGRKDAKALRDFQQRLYA